MTSEVVCHGVTLVTKLISLCGYALIRDSESFTLFFELQLSSQACIFPLPLQHSQSLDAESFSKRTALLQNHLDRLSALLAF